MTVPARASRNAAASALAQIAGKASTLVWTLVAARMMTRGEFGQFNFALSVALLVGACAEWGFDPALVRRGSRHPDQLEQLFAESAVWQTLIAVPLFVATGIFVAIVRPEPAVRAAVALLLLAVFLDLWNDTARAVSTAVHKQSPTAAALVVQRVATMVLAVPVLLAGGRVVALAVVFATSYAIGFAAHQLALRRLHLRFRPRVVTRDGLRSFARGTGAIGISALVLMALARADAVLLAAISGDAALGSYSTAYRLFETALFLVFAVSSALYPVMSATPDDSEGVRRSVESALAALAVAYVPMAAVCLVDAPGVLGLLFGQEYAHTAAGALRWLSITPLIYSAAYLASSALVAIMRTRVVLVGALIALALNLALNLALLPRFAGTGAAFATTASYGVEAAVLLVALSRTTRRIRVLAPLAVPSVASAVMAVWLLASHLSTLVELLVGVAGYAALWLALASRFNPEQVDVLRGFLPNQRGSAT